MNLHRMLLARAAQQRPLRVALIGAGKFGSMYLSQAQHTPGIHVVAVADLAPDRARASLARVGWPDERYARAVARRGRAPRHDLRHRRCDEPPSPPRETEIVIDATGNPAAGIRHVLACCAHGKHIVMVNVEADALAGPLLAERARARASCTRSPTATSPRSSARWSTGPRGRASRSSRRARARSTCPSITRRRPRPCGRYYGFDEEMVATGDFNAQMFNSFLDGTKSAIEMAAVANATGLTPAPDGLAFPPCGVDDLPRILRPRAEGGILHHAGQVEVISSLERDGRPVFRDLRWGVYVTSRGRAHGEDYVRRCFREYGFSTDPSGRYSAMYKPYHAIGLELGISVATVGLRSEPTGQAPAWRGDVVATAKRDLAAGETLDGEGGYTVYGKLMPAAASKALGGLPLGLAHGVKLTRAVAANAPVRWDDVSYDASDDAVRFRREMEATLTST